MPDLAASATRAYHERTKHTPTSVRRDARPLDWANEPRPYKLYPTAPSLRLPSARPLSARPALAVLAAGSAGDGGAAVPNLAHLATLLHHALGITHRRRLPNRVMHFRAAACTGALYHVEAYVVCADLVGLPAGVYHFQPQTNTLKHLRAGDHRALLAEASGREPAVASAPLTVVLTSLIWRNAWKYRERAYRHAFWDGGTILANLLAVAAAHDLPARVVSGFVDGTVNHLLGVDGEREFALALALVGRGGPPLAASAPPPPLDLPTITDAGHDIPYPAISAAHQASSFATPAEAARWREAATRALALTPTTDSAPERVTEAPAGEATNTAIEDVISRRGSSRRFSGEPIDGAALETIVRALTAPLDADYRAPNAPIAQPFLIVNRVTGREPAVYRYGRAGGWQVVAPAVSPAEAAHLALDQPLAGDAAVCCYLLADLVALYSRLGERGYRAAQLDGGIMAGRGYLAAYGLGLGASGLTFYDDDVIAALGPEAAGRDVLFLLALGRAARRGSSFS